MDVIVHHDERQHLIALSVEVSERGGDEISLDIGQIWLEGMQPPGDEVCRSGSLDVWESSLVHVQHRMGGKVAID
jgi:hypothetical protein